MAQIDLIFNSEDHSQLILDILALGFQFIPDSRYDTSTYDVASTLEQVKSYAVNTAHFFLLNNTFQESPLLLRRNSETGGWHICQRRGGPVMDYVMHTTLGNEPDIRLPSSFIGVDATYKSTSSNIMLKTPEKLIALYRGLAKVMRQRCHKVTATRTYYVGAGAMNDLRSGTRIGVKGLESYVF